MVNFELVKKDTAKNQGYFGTKSRLIKVLHIITINNVSNFSIIVY